MNIEPLTAPGDLLVTPYDTLFVTDSYVKKLGGSYIETIHSHAASDSKQRRGFLNRAVYVMTSYGTIRNKNNNDEYIVIKREPCVQLNTHK